MIYSKDNQYTQYLGDAREVLKELPEHSVDCIMTSPPYFGLRSYKAPASIWDDGWQGILGSEPTVQLYISHLCDIFDLCRRVLKPTGSLWVNLDDSHAGSGGCHKETHKNDSGFQGKLDPLKGGQAIFSSGIPAKSLCAVPERFVVEMVDRGWILRNTIIWQKLSCMPESAKDRFTIDFEYLYFFSVKPKYFFSRQFEPYDKPLDRWGGDTKKTTDNLLPESPYVGAHREREMRPNSLGRNHRSVWVINPEPQAPSKKKGEVRHYAAFPPALCTTPILACVPEQICTKCGKPRVKMYKTGELVADYKGSKPRGELKPDALVCKITAKGFDKPTPNHHYEVKEIGLSDCGCNAPFRPGVILDPFSGTGTVAVEARKLGRHAVLIDISEPYCKIAQKRLERIAIPLGMENL